MQTLELETCEIVIDIRNPETNEKTTHVLDVVQLTHEFGELGLEGLPVGEWTEACQSHLATKHKVTLSCAQVFKLCQHLKAKYDVFKKKLDDDLVSSSNSDSDTSQSANNTCERLNEQLSP